MKKVLIFGFFIAFFAMSLKAQVTCYGQEESAEVGFWFDHFYYAKCTDWEATGSKLFGPDEDYIDFNGGSSVDFTNIFVEKDGDYTVTMSYGVGYADEEIGGLLNIFVNGQLAEQFNFFRNPDRPITYEFTVELWADWDNVIQFKQERDWPILLGIQLSNGSTITGKRVEAHSVYSSNGMINIVNPAGKCDVQIYSIDGKLVKSASSIEALISLPVRAGFYILKINGTAQKIIVK